MTQVKEIQAAPVEQAGQAVELGDRAPRRTTGPSLLGSVSLGLHLAGMHIFADSMHATAGGKRRPLGRPLLDRR